jgi:hypothetical protein
MPQITLTDRFCASAKALSGRIDYFDATVPGLAIGVIDKGHRSWSFPYTPPWHGKLARAKLGNYRGTSIPHVLHSDLATRL